MYIFITFILAERQLRYAEHTDSGEHSVYTLAEQTSLDTK